MGGDRRRLIFLKMENKQTKEVRQFDLDRDMPILRAYLKRRPNTAVIKIDPLVSQFNPKDGSEHAIRRKLEALAALAQEFNIIVIGIMHFRKSRAEKGRHCRRFQAA
jgi:hypothetical protein